MTDSREVGPVSVSRDGNDRTNRQTNPWPCNKFVGINVGYEYGYESLLNTRAK